MEKHMKILILLACLSLVAPALCVSIQGGSDNVVSSPNAVVSGGSFVTTDVNTPTEIGFTAGIRAHAEIPEGSDGFAYSHWSGANNTSMGLGASNGNGYSLMVGYGGTVNADVTKNSLMGVAVSDAEISAHAHANAATNQIDGSANINASTSNTGLGQTQALAAGNASYDVRQTSNATGAPGKEVFGGVSGTIDLHTANLDNGVSYNSSGIFEGLPQGSVSGSAYIRSMSMANNTTSTSNSTMSIDNLGAMRLGRDGVSHIGGVVMGNTTAGSWNGGTPANLTKTRGMNENAATEVNGTLVSMANAYAPGDSANASGRLRSDAVQILMGDGYNNATNTANTSVSIVRTAADYPAAVASAESSISKGSFNATSRDNTVTPTFTFAEENASRVNMRSAISAQNPWSGNNSITSTLQGLYDARFNTTTPEIYLASLTNKIVNNGPNMTGSVADFSIAEENITGQHAKSMDGPDVTSVDLSSKSILSFIDGNTTVPGGLAKLGPVSTPIFDNSTDAMHNVTGPTATPSMTNITQNNITQTNITQNSNVISYNATSFFLRAPEA